MTYRLKSTRCFSMHICRVQMHRRRLLLEFTNNLRKATLVELKLSMRRMNNLITLFTAITAFFFGSFITKILTSVDKCTLRLSKLEPHPDIFVVILVLSAPQKTEIRNVMRETWLRMVNKPLAQPYYPEDHIYLPTYVESGHLTMETVASQANRLRLYMKWQEQLPVMDVPKTQRNIKVKHFFAIGTHQLSDNIHAELLREQKKHNDLLFLPSLNDSYANLTAKLLQSMVELTHEYKFSYLLKVDDDSYVRLDSLLNELVSYDRKLLRKTNDYGQSQLPQLYWGYFNGRGVVHRKGIWGEHNYHLSKNYITYALGGGYVLARKLCEFVANNSAYLSTYVSEDVSMGTWLAPLKFVYRWHDPRFDTAYLPRKCRPQHLVLHKRNEVMMRELYESNLCIIKLVEGKRAVPEYYYDWTKPADQCCDSLVV